MGGIIDMVTGKSGKDAARASTDAANISANAQGEALDYIKETEALPQQYRQEALGKLSGLFGLEGGQGNQQEFINQAMESPLYKQLIGNQKFGEDAILRNQAATGGFRSGNTQKNLSEYNTRLSNEALLSSYNNNLQGLTGLANIPSNTNQIAGMMSGIGNTQAQGRIAGANAIQQGNQGMFNAAAGLGGAALMAFSDIRLKTNIVKIGRKNGYNIYKWTWRKIANKLHLAGEGFGVMAHEVFNLNPDAVSTKYGHLLVDYQKLGVLNG